MNLQWILSPAALYAGLGVVLGACLALFLSLKKDLHAARAQARDAAAAAEARIAALAAEAQGLEQRLREIENAPASPPPSHSLNLTKRAQALRMFRRGEALCTIAAAVHAPQNEILLLTKIHELASGNR